MDSLLIALVLQDLVQTLRVIFAEELIELLRQVLVAALLWNLISLQLHATQEALEAEIVDLIGFTAAKFKCFDLLSLNLASQMLLNTALL